MNLTNRRVLLSSFTFAAAVALTAPAIAADCAAPKGIGEVRACAAATKGVTALRRFVARTQPIYQLSVYEFDVTAPAVATVAEPVRVAAVK